MKNIFPGYYRPTIKEFSNLWNSCLFVLDANVLLNLYRYSQETSDELIQILKQVSGRLWVPHQAAFEYQKNRLQIIASQIEEYDKNGKPMQSPMNFRRARARAKKPDTGKKITKDKRYHSKSK